MLYDLLTRFKKDNYILETKRGPKQIKRLQVKSKGERVRSDIFVKMKTYAIRNGEIYDPQVGDYVPVLAAVRGAPLAIWIYLATCVDDVERAWPGRAKIAEATGYKKQTVTQAVARLERLGLITITRMRFDDSNQMMNMYHVNKMFFEFGNTPEV